MVLNLYDFIQSSPWPEEWLEKMTESMNIPDGTDFGKTLWGSVLLSSVKIELEGLKEMISRALEILKDASGLEKYRAVYMEDLANVDALLKLLNEESEMQWDRIFNALQGFEFATLPRCGREVDKDKQEIVKKIRDDVKQRIRKFREKVITSVPMKL